MPRRGMNTIFITEERKPPKPFGNFPAVSDVREGVTYDTNMVGTLVVTTGTAESGFGVGGYGDIYGSDAAVTGNAYTTTANGLVKPNYAVVAWGALENTNLDAIEVLINRIIVLEA